MKFPTSIVPATRRLMLAAALGAGFAIAAPAAAQSYPSKPVRLIVPFPPGSAPDVVARLIADKLGAAWGQTLIIDNKAGAGGIPGMSALARSPNDGYTLGFVPAAPVTVTPLLFKNPQFDIDKDVSPIALIGTSPLLFVTPAASPVKTLADLEKQGKAQPGKLNFAAAQTNSLPHIAGELLNKTGGMQLFTVPYAGAPAAITATIAGDAVLTIDGLPGLLPHVKSGRLRPLAVTSPKRLPGFDDIPTVAETYSGYELTGWFCIFAPTGMPAAAAEKLNRDVTQVMQAPDLVARLAEVGIYPRTGSIADARSYVQGQRDTIKRIVGTLGLQPE